jgi:hypothetical protein
MSKNNNNGISCVHTHMLIHTHIVVLRGSNKDR